MKVKGKTSKKDSTVSLGSLVGGDVFRFSHINASEALIENAFYMVIVLPEKQSVVIANLLDGQCLARDKEHRVIKHEANLNIDI